MYECPITNYISEIYDKQMVERENAIIMKVSETIGVDVNREELIKALNYDRNQYEKGYADAKAEYESMFDKIIADIDTKAFHFLRLQNMQRVHGLEDALEVINKYREGDKE